MEELLKVVAANDTKGLQAPVDAIIEQTKLNLSEADSAEELPDIMKLHQKRIKAYRWARSEAAKIESLRRDLVY